MPSDTPSDALPTLRWGIIATGMVSSWFVRDLARQRPDAKARHIIQAIGSSSKEKGDAFVKEFIPHERPPTVYGSYTEVYADPAVDAVYVGTPHGLHRQICLDAIAAGKHVLCEKAFAVTAKEAREVFDAARAKGGVFVMEALRTRFFPLTRTLLRMVHEEGVIGHVHRVFCDLGLDMERDLAALGSDSRLKNPRLGAGSLLDVGLYSLTWGRMLLDQNCGDTSERPHLLATQTLSGSDEYAIDTTTSILLQYPSTGGQGILTSTSLARTPPVFCRIEGSRGVITVEGESASIPTAFTVYPKAPEQDWNQAPQAAPPGTRYSFDVPGFGLYWEADAVALDIAQGRVENSVMPWEETLRIMDMMDEARRQGGARFPQDVE